MYHDAVWVPTCKLQEKIISIYHDNMAAGHLGICKTKELICRDYNWKELIKMVEAYVKDCTCCI